MTKLPEQIAALEAQAAKIKNNPDNVVGGLDAWFSGRRTTLKPAAQKKLDKINAQLDALYDQCEA